MCLILYLLWFIVMFGVQHLYLLFLAFPTMWFLWMIILDLYGYFCSNISMKCYLCLSILRHLLRINFLLNLKCLGQIMVLNTPILPFKPFVPLIAFCIKLLVLIPFNRMGFLKEKIGTLLKLVSLYFIGLIYLTITGLMHFPLQFFSLIDYPLLSWISSFLGNFCTLNHLLFKLLRHLVVLAILILGLTIRTSYNLGLNNAFFWVILHCIRAISTLSYKQ